MFFGIIVLLTALIISGIAAYYSILGLTAIFAAAFWPIVIMGGVLEIGKIVSTVWLHNNWKRAPWRYKAYLVPAVLTLMLITSMGIFGFLSRSHLEQAVPSGDISAQVALFDEKIKTQRDNIGVAKKAIEQMNASVDQLVGRSDDEKGVERSLQVRRGQAKERATLQKEIDAAQKEIIKLQEQRAPISSQLRKVESDVGPIKYIAALIYGDNPDQNLLERAVRWVIIIIVAVFDPLALTLILAATLSFEWAKEDRKKKLAEVQSILPPVIPTSTGPTMKEAHADYVNSLVDENVIPKQEYSVIEPEPSRFRETDVPDVVEPEPVATVEAVAKELPSGKFLKEVPPEPAMDAPPVESVNPPATSIAGKIHKLNLIPEEKNGITTEPATASFGTKFTDNPKTGDLFLRVDMLPSQLFKYNGQSWIPVDKLKTDMLAYDEQYLKFLMDKLSSGEYDVDDLSDTEQEQLNKFLQPK